MFATHSSALAFTYSDWLEEPEPWKVGYVFGVMESLAQLVESSSKNSFDVATAYQKCFRENKIDSKAGLTIIENHLRRDPEAATTDMFRNTVTAFSTACKRYLPPPPP
jgi:hypothetical protein